MSKKEKEDKPFSEEIQDLVLRQRDIKRQYTYAFISLGMIAFLLVLLGVDRPSDLSTALQSVIVVIITMIGLTVLTTSRLIDSQDKETNLRREVVRSKTNSAMKALDGYIEQAKSRSNEERKSG